MTAQDDPLARLLISRKKHRKTAREIAQMTDLERMMKGYGLTTAQLYYGFPDHPEVLNTFIWQEYDLAPDYPILFKFIEFWQREIDGPLRGVEFTHRKMVAPGEWRNVVAHFDI
jgi:uncharacterized protein Usg